MPRRSSSFDISPTGTNHTGFTPFPIFHPIRESPLIARRLTNAGLDIQDDHVHVVRNMSSRSTRDPYEQEDELDRRFRASSQFYENQGFDAFGPRFSRITITSIPCYSIQTSGTNYPPSGSLSSSYSRQTRLKTLSPIKQIEYTPSSPPSSNGPTYRYDPATGKILPKRPSSVFEEMSNGYGFKSIRKSSPASDHIYSPPIWNDKQLKSSPVNSILEPVNVKILSHQRRFSTVMNAGQNNLRRRRSSVLNTLFGEVGNRRFSEDLRARIPEEADSEHEEEGRETAKVIFFQVFIPFLVAGFGNVGAGLILDYVQHWPVFRNTPELFILVASFLGFKGNLEMTLAARLATQANLGHLDNLKAQVDIGIGNVALIQAQATVVAFLAAVIAIAINYFKEFQFDPKSCLLILMTSLVTAAITGLFLSLLMVVVTVLSRKIGVNPDNVSTLLAAFLGDISAVILLAGSARMFYEYSHVYWLPYAVMSFFLLILPIFLVIARRNPYTHDVVFTGWFPIIIAMIISSIGGLIFDFAVETFQTIAVFQPIINGVGANLVAVQASRISTYLHQRVELGTLPLDEEGDKYHICQSPFAAFFGKNPNVRTARLLLLMSIPGHIIYVITIRLIEPGQVFITLPFMAFYLIVAVVQVVILLYMAHLIVPFLWSKKIDPDNAAIPGIMSCGDLLGTAFLTIAYFILEQMADPNTNNYMPHSEISPEL